MMFDKPVVLQVLPALGTGGVERGTVEIAQAIIQSGGVAIVASADGIWRPTLERQGCVCINLPLNTKNPWKIWKNQFALAKVIRDYKVDIVHVRSRGPAWSAWLAVQKNNTHFITTWHGVYSETWRGKRWYNQVMARGERVIAISHYVADRLQKKYNLSLEKLRVIPRGVDLRQFDADQPLGERVNVLASKWGITEDQKIILLPGRLTEWKGHELLVQAFAQLKAEFPSWICVFVGPSKKKDRFTKRLMEFAKRLKISDTLYFVGDCQDMPAALSLADIVIVPSLKPEPFGRVVIEAQAMEKTVVVANHGGAAETVVDGKTGFVFQPRNSDSLRNILQILMQQSDHDLHWTGRLAKEDVQENYTVFQMQKATLHVYNEVLPENKRFKL